MRKILIVLAFILAFATPWLFVGADALSEYTGWAQKVFECGSVVTFWCASLLFIIATQKDEDKKGA